MARSLTKLKRKRSSLEARKKSSSGGKLSKASHGRAPDNETSEASPKSTRANRKSKKLRWDHALEDVSQEASNAPNNTEQSSLEDDEIVESDTLETSLAITCHQGRIGAASYDPRKSVLYLLDDTSEGSHFDLAKLLLDQVTPDLIITSSRTDEKLIQECQNYAEESSCRFQIRPHREFVAERGKDRLLSLRLLNQGASVPPRDETPEARNAYDFMRSRHEAQGGDPVTKRRHAAIRAHNYATMDVPLCLSAVGALLDHLVRTKAAEDLEDEGIGALDILDIEVLALNEVMQINADALSSLNIFSDEIHASLHSNRTKEGLSLFGILDKTRTSLGKQLLRQWLLRPSLSLDVIADRHDAVECFVNGENILTADAMHGHLGGIKNVPRILGLLRKGKAGWKEWSALVKFTYHGIMLREAVTELSSASAVPIIKKVVSALDVAKFREMGALVNDRIDWEASQIEARVCVRPLVDPELDERKNIYNSLSTFLSQVAIRVANEVPPEYRAALNVLYFPQLGYLITIPFREEWKTSESLDLFPGWTYQFSTEEQIYFKSQDMHDLDLHIGDLKSLIMDREIEIIHALQEEVLEFHDAIVNACDVCAELDCLLSFAEASRAYGYTRPEMSHENIMEIQQGRHPLQEICEATFVPNDFSIVGGKGLGVAQNTGAQETRSSDSDLSSDEEGLEGGLMADDSSRVGGQKHSIMICTGANACGKSVYLKQNALIPIMAQVGCFVPAESARLGLIDKVFTRIQTRESVSKMQSAFMIDLAQVSLALRNCTARSLILLDEFGKGTIAADGAGLLCGVLEHLISRGSTCPKVIATTHFHEVFHHGLLRRDLPISFAHMEVIISTSDRTHDLQSMSDLASDNGERGRNDDEHAKPSLVEEFTFLYRVAPGLSLHSHAAQCALMNGVPRPIVQRAIYVSKLLADHELTTLLDEGMTGDEEQELEEAEVIAKRFAALDLSDDTNIKARLAVILGREE